MQKQKTKTLLFLRMIANTVILFTLMSSLNGAYKSGEKYFQFYLIAVGGFLVYGMLMYGAFLEYNRIRSGNKGSASVNPVSEADVYLALMGERSKPSRCCRKL